MNRREESNGVDQTGLRMVAVGANKADVNCISSGKELHVYIHTYTYTTFRYTWSKVKRDRSQYSATNLRRNRLYYKEMYASKGKEPIFFWVCDCDKRTREVQPSNASTNL